MKASTRSIQTGFFSIFHIKLEHCDSSKGKRRQHPGGDGVYMADVITNLAINTECGLYFLIL